MRNDETASQTALVVALAFIILHGDDYGRTRCPAATRPWSSDHGADRMMIPIHTNCPLELQRHILLAGGLVPSWLLSFVSHACITKWTRFFLNTLVCKDTLEGLGMRKCFMEQHVRNRIQAVATSLSSSSSSSRTVGGGCTQVLVLAAGYDTLAVRLSLEYPDIQFWELDHPNTARRKQQALRTIFMTQNKTNMPTVTNFHMVSADLTQTTLPDVLSQQVGYDTTAPTVVVMEGLLMYLTETQVQRLWQDTAQVVGNTPSSAICLDYFGWNNKTGRLANVGGWLAPLLLHRFVASVGEPWKWGIAPEQLPVFVQDASSAAWRVVVGPTRAYGLEHLAVLERRASL